MFELRRPSKSQWLETVMADLDRFLVDHAACERKASALGMSFVVRYPDRHAMLDELIAFSREELEHFHIMYRVLRERGLSFADDYRDEYVGALRRLVRTGREERLLDMLVLAGVVEARGCERMGLVRDALPTGELKRVYEELTRAEARHHGLFFRLARLFFAESEIRERSDYFLDQEVGILEAQPLLPRLH